MDCEMKTISVVIPCYNEEKSIREMYHRLKKIFEEELTQYDYEIIYVDDFSKDNTRAEIEKLCAEDKKVKAVFNARNFGFDRNVFQSYQYATGDCAFMLFGDLQDPPEMLPQFVKKWEEGYKCIVGQRKRSDENHFMYVFRRVVLLPEWYRYLPLLATHFLWLWSDHYSCMSRPKQHRYPAVYFPALL